MACTRRSLTSTFSLLSRRLHPSLSHISGNRRPLPPIPSPVPCFSPRFDSRFSLGFAPHRFYSSSSNITDAEIMTDVANVIPDPSADFTVLSDSSFDVVVSAVPMPFPGEVAAAAADSFLPVAALQYLIDGVQSFTGLQWWAAIALTTVLIRGSMVPLFVNQASSAIKLNLQLTRVTGGDFSNGILGLLYCAAWYRQGVKRPMGIHRLQDLMMRLELEERIQDMQNSVDPESIKEVQMRMGALLKKHGVTPFTPLKEFFIRGPIFISFFLAIQNMAANVPSFKAGGTLWFTDLTTPDPMYILPVLTSLTFLAIVELKMPHGMGRNPTVDTAKNIARILALMTIPVTAYFPKAIFCYCITSNIFTISLIKVLRCPPVRAYLNLHVKATSNSRAKFEKQ